ncbi:hypothetical protein ACH5RR_041226 [Cinchona calisaya]|uniref:KIB1-4 beta-propeller domain-containing protein n=1 Tax=Cinchona calisaya TaxID=153742 RepID=A0ABD2XT87_9GENT
MGDWSQLIPDLLVSIAKRIQSVEDFVAFGGVCSSWRAAAIKDNFVESWPTVPLLMLAERKIATIGNFTVYLKARFGGGYLSPEQKVKNVSNREDGLSLWKPSDTSEYVVIVIHSATSFLGFWKPGYDSWKRIDTYNNWTRLQPFNVVFSDVNYYNGKFYAISYERDVWVLDISESANARYLFSIDYELIKCRGKYLVDSGGELLIVARNGTGLSDDEEETYGVTDFRVIQLDLNKSRWKEVKSLGERAIFLGHNSAFLWMLLAFRV